MFDDPLPFLSKRTLTKKRFPPFPATRGDSRRESKTEFAETQEERKKKEATSSKGPIVFQESSEARLSADSVFSF